MKRVVIIGALVGLLAGYVGPVRGYLGQKAALSREEARLTRLEAERDRLARRLDALEDPVVLETLARELDYARPGEAVFHIRRPPRRPRSAPGGG